jgi:hypothetical protein
MGDAGHRPSAATKRAPAGAQPRRAGAFRGVGSSNGSPDYGRAALLPAPRNSSGAGASIWKDHALGRGAAAGGERKEIAQEGVAVLGGDAFGMKLNAMYRALAMFEPHDDTVFRGRGDT